MKTVPIVVQVSEKVLKQLLESVDPNKELSNALDAWVDSCSKEADNDITLKGKYIGCTRNNQRIEAAVCLSRIKKKQRGCGSCKRGKALLKVEELLKEI